MQDVPMGRDACKRLLPHLSATREEQTSCGVVATADGLQELRELDTLHSPWLRKYEVLVREGQQQQQQLQDAASAQPSAGATERPPSSAQQQQLLGPPAAPGAAAASQFYLGSPTQPHAATLAAAQRASHVDPVETPIDLTNSNPDDAAAAEVRDVSANSLCLCFSCWILMPQSLVMFAHERSASAHLSLSRHHFLLG